MSDFLRTLLELVEGGQECVTATLVDAAGSSPGKPGHRMIILPGGSIRFTVGGGPLEAMVLQDGLDFMARRENGVRSYRLLPHGEDAVGMVCGGSVRVFFEHHPPAPSLIVFGAGHVGAELINLAAGLGFRRVAADDRAEFVAAGRFPPDVCTHHCGEGYRGDLPPVGPDAYVVLVTRCHATDRELLERLGRQPVAYLGMIGSRRKVETVLGELEACGIPRSSLAHLHAPVGLEIGAHTPREIAVAILAEMLAVRSGAAARGSLARAKSRPAAPR